MPWIVVLVTLDLATYVHKKAVMDKKADESAFVLATVTYILPFFIAG